MARNAPTTTAGNTEDNTYIQFENFLHKMQENPVHDIANMQIKFSVKQSQCTKDCDLRP